MTNDRVLLAIPAHNEERSIEGVVSDALATGLPVIVVDDGSDDATAAIARNAGAVVLSLPVNLGVGGARRCAYRYAVAHGYNCLAECDADGQHPVHAISHLINEAQSRNLDMLIGSRFTEGVSSTLEASRLRRSAMRFLAASASRATRSQITDSTSGLESSGSLCYRLSLRASPPTTSATLSRQSLPPAAPDIGSERHRYK